MKLSGNTAFLLSFASLGMLLSLRPDPVRLGVEDVRKELIPPARPPAPGDTVRFRIIWSHQVGPRQLPIDSFLVDIRTVATDSVLDRGVAIPPQMQDTLVVRAPAVGDTLGPLIATVRAVDASGAISNPGTSNPFSVVGVPLPPSAPGGVNADTTGFSFEALLDSLETLPLADRPSLSIRGWPQDGFTWRFCAFIPVGEIIGVAPYNDYCITRAELFRTEVGL